MCATGREESVEAICDGIIERGRYRKRCGATFMRHSGIIYGYVCVRIIDMAHQQATCLAVTRQSGWCRDKLGYLEIVHIEAEIGHAVV